MSDQEAKAGEADEKGCCSGAKKCCGGKALAAIALLAIGGIGGYAAGKCCASRAAAAAPAPAPSK